MEENNNPPNELSEEQINTWNKLTHILNNPSTKLGAHSRLRKYANTIAQTTSSLSAEGVTYHKHPKKK